MAQPKPARYDDGSPAITAKHENLTLLYARKATAGGASDASRLANRGSRKTVYRAANSAAGAGISVRLLPRSHPWKRSI